MRKTGKFLLNAVIFMGIAFFLILCAPLVLLGAVSMKDNTDGEYYDF